MSAVMSNPVRVLTVEEVADLRARAMVARGASVRHLCDTVEALRSQLAEATRTWRRQGLDEAIAALPPSRLEGYVPWSANEAKGYNDARRDTRKALEQLRDTPPPKETP